MLDCLLLQHPDTPRNRAKQWILAGRVSVNGAVVRKPHQPVADAGDTVLLRPRHATTLDCGSGWQIHPRVSLLYLDSALAIVNKGPGLISVPAPDSELSALSILADFLAGKLQPRDHRVATRTLPAAYRRLEPLPVHRLDQYTSGVFCLAMNPAARRHLIEQVRTHTMRREYVAFVEGRPRQQKGTWRHKMQLSRDERRQEILSESEVEAAGPEAVEAITHYEVLATYPIPGDRVVTKLKLRLETGLRHQIRVQAANAGLPLLGDRTYNPWARDRSRKESELDFPRQALHAETLTLEHPDQPGKRLSWTASWPKDLRQLEATLRSGGPLNSIH